MRLVLLLTLLAITLPALCAPVPEDQLQDVVIADYRYYGAGVAFYIDASQKWKHRFMGALERALNQSKPDCDPPSDCSWFHNPKSLRYFRAVMSSGSPSDTGLACPNELWLLHRRYYEKELSSEYLTISWDGRAHRFEIQHFPET
jgi:hypothetical protein